MFGIPAESVTQYLMRLLHDDKRFGIQLHHQFLQLGDLLLFHRSQNHFGLRMAVAALCMEECGTTVQLTAYGSSNGFILGRK